MLFSCIFPASDVSLSQLERSVVDVLAWQRLEQLLCPPGPSTPPVVTKPLPARALVCPLVQDSHLQDWAVKTPTPTYCCEPVLMTYRIMRVGKGKLVYLILNSFFMYLISSGCSCLEACRIWGYLCIVRRPYLHLPKLVLKVWVLLFV